jgi:hypothetical protein
VAVLYTVGGSHYDYASLTIFNKLRETVPEHTVNISLSLKEPWGSLGASTNFTQQLNHLASYRLGSYTEANIRVYKGLSVNMSFEYDRIRNQIYLAQGAVSTDEVLLRIRQLATTTATTAASASATASAPSSTTSSIHGSAGRRRRRAPQALVGGLQSRGAAIVSTMTRN